MQGMRDLTDPAVLALIGERIAQHRLQRNLTQTQLAREAGVSKRTLIRLEGGESSQVTNLIRVVRALGLLGGLDAFLPPPPVSPIAQLQMQAKARRRASPERASDTPPTKWTWGDESPKARGAR